MRGHISQKSNGTWVGVVDAPRKADGKRNQKFVYGKTQPEVEKKLTELIYKINTNNFVDPTNILLKQYLNNWLAERKNALSPATYDGYKSYIDRHIIPAIGEKKLNKILPKDVEHFYNSKKDTLSGKSLHQVHSILHRAFKDALINEYIARNIIDFVNPPKVEKHTMKTYEEDQYIKLLKSVENISDEIPIMLAGGLGLRRGEIFGLRWSDISFDKKIITVNQNLVCTRSGLVFKKPKSIESIRTISVPDYIIKKLKERYKEQEELKSKQPEDYQNHNLVCCKSNGEPINPSTYSHVFADILKNNGLEHIRLHDLRHFNATIMMKYGVPIKVASKRLGHSTTQITQDIYQHVLVSMDTDASDKISEHLFDKKAKN